MTRLELQTRIQNYLSNPAYFTNVDLNDSIQDGLDEVCAFSGCIWKSASVPFTANKTYYDLLTLLPDYLGVISIFNSVTRRWMIPTSTRKLDQSRLDWEICAGTPEYFVPVSHRFVAIFKKPIVANYGNFYIFYRATAPTLTDTTTIPILPDNTTLLDAYALQDMWEQQQEFAKAVEHFSTYVKELHELKNQMNNRNPARLSSLK